jgi:molecular chaperone Hsp33
VSELISDGDAIRVTPPTGEDCVRPFVIEAGNVRGRIVRLNTSLHKVLAGHDYPEPVSRLLGQTLVMSVLLSSALKYDGKFTLQTKSDGPVSMMVADVTSDGGIRGYARYDEDALAEIEPAAAELAPVPSLMGSGYLAFTVDQGSGTDLYQGIVPLEGATLSDCVLDYFRRSEQIETETEIAVGRSPFGEWIGCGMMLQRLPDETLPEGVTVEEAEDDWARHKLLVESLKADEMLDLRLTGIDLIWRLFNEDQVRVAEERTISANCGCGRDRLLSAMASFAQADIEDMMEDGRIEVTCEFCHSVFTFTADDFEETETVN